MSCLCPRPLGALAIPLLVLTAAVSSAAQQGPAPGVIPTQLTLQLATEIFLARNPAILRERQNITMARTGVMQARLLPNPEFEITSEGYPLFGSTPGPFFKTTNSSSARAKPSRLRANEESARGWRSRKPSWQRRSFRTPSGNFGSN